ncbi:uncharacterized protein LOC119102635 isoform X2 [Pollicipes pollicipes]|uniref:uncharacterized protein LOC119102635 isoform X2 n=1 Tax=Pollicipes pollicipes TaxID=41117 RepID=UPI001885692E|nr:uncharacterized protein LOC119102635 isoform X2 [Pollicipes pollicipes]
MACRKRRPRFAAVVGGGTMRTDRGPGLGSAELTAAAGPDKSGSTDSLDEPAAVARTQRPQRTAASVADVGFASDPDEDTATFKSALSSSEALRQREGATTMADVTGTAVAVPPPQPSAGDAVWTNGGGSPAGDPAKLWRGGDGRTVRDIVENGLSGDDSARLASGGRTTGALDSLGPESLSHGPESLSQGPESLSHGPESLSHGPESLSMTPLDDDYYEDFTMPGTHESVMSRQMSFRRRVRAAPVTEPDADRIERLVRAGELERHGSIRRRLVAPSAPAPAAGSPGRFGRDLREIEELMAEDGDQVAIDELPSLGPVLGSSTPKTPGGEQPASLPPLGDEPLSMENSTVMKIRECLDREKVKDIYTISGRLQDILTQEDIQEILAHSEMFAELLGEGILAELRSSMCESQRSTPPQAPTPAPRRSPASAPAPPNVITVQAEVNAELEPEDLPVPSPRHLVAGAAELGADPDVARAAERDGPASLPEPAAPPAPEEPTGRLWRSGSMRRLDGSGPPVEALFAESDAAPPAGQRRLPAPAISLDDSEPVGDQSTLSAPSAKPADADSGVSEGAPADLQPSGDEAGGRETALPPGRHERRAERPSSLSQRRRKKISVTADVLEDEDSMSTSSVSQLDSDTEPVTPTDALATADLLDTLTPDDIDTPDELEDSILGRLPPAEPIPEYTAREELNNERSWRTCVVAGLERRIDMKVIEPYKKVLSHGGYLGLEGDQAIIVFSACYLPDRSRRDYSYVMDNLFLYVLTTLDALIAEDYVLIYLHGATQRSCMPSFGWLKRCYQMVDRRLRKNLKGLYLVHPTFWVKTIVALTRPFISSKFSRKLRFVAGLRELSQLVPMDHVCIPDRVKQYDEIKESLQVKGGTSRD